MACLLCTLCFTASKQQTSYGHPQSELLCCHLHCTDHQSCHCQRYRQDVYPSMLMLAGLLVPACRQAHDPKSGQYKRGPQRGHHPCHCASLLAPYISGELPSSFVPLTLLFCPTVSSGPLLLLLLLLMLMLSSSHFAVVDVTVLACLRHICQVNFRLPLSL